MEIMQGVHQIKIPLPDLPPGHVNVYMVEGKESNLLIDAGWNTPEAFSVLRDELKKDGFSFNDIGQIVITHLHPDHYGLAGKIKELSGATIALSEIEAGMLDLRYVKMNILLKEMVDFLSSNGVPQDELPQLSEASLPISRFVIPALPDIKLKAGDKISVDSLEFEVLLTPGHSPGHICLYEPRRRFLFSGDHVLPEITPTIGFHPQSGINPLGDFVDSLKSLSKLDANFIFPAHDSVFNGLGLRIEELLRHHEQRKSTILRIIKDDMRTGYEVANGIPWVNDINPVSFQDLATLDRRVAVLETLAHLQLLVFEDKARKVIRDNVNFYWASS